MVEPPLECDDEAADAAVRVVRSILDSQAKAGFSGLLQGNREARSPQEGRKTSGATSCARRSRRDPYGWRRSTNRPTVARTLRHGVHDALPETVAESAGAGQG